VNSAGTKKGTDKKRYRNERGSRVSSTDPIREPKIRKACYAASVRTDQCLPVRQPDIAVDASFETRSKRSNTLRVRVRVRDRVRVFMSLTLSLPLTLA